MPNFTEEQTRVAIHETSTGHYTLKIVAQAENAAVRKIMAKENNETNSESEQIISSTFFEGKHRNLSYHDGKLEVTVDLPRDVKAHTYELEFADHALKIEFERDEAKS